MNVGYLLTRSARYYRDRIAFVIDGEPKTFGQVNSRVNQLANGLLSIGLKKGDRVGLLFHNSFECLESYFALYKSGLIWVRLNSRLTGEELRNIAGDSGMRALIHGPELSDMAEMISDGLLRVISAGSGPGDDYEKFLSRYPEREPDTEVYPEDLSDLWYTSGTTGLPKGIQITHRNILTCVQFLLSDVYDISRSDRFLTSGALSHAGSVRILPFITRGAACYLHSRFDPSRIFEEIQEAGITDLAVVPTMLIGLLDHPERERFDLSSLKRITYAGSPMPVERIKEALAAFGPVLDQSYGQAESIITITHLSRTEHASDNDPEGIRRLASVGREYPGVAVRIVDETGTELESGGVGEIVTRSDLVMKGYWNQPEKTKEALRNGWLHTGDIGYMDEEGYLYLVDRKNDKIITGGLNVFPREVEEIVAAHPAVAQVCVFGVPHDLWGEAVTAAVVVKEQMNLDEAELMRYCREKIAGYKRPKQVHFREDLPKNLYGKVLRKDLKIMYGHNRNNTGDTTI
ncbi:MAG: long-chain fatty acid--CoA ligase [Desulfobacteraceae bacterium]|nr:long-chain fatty acid--CoA ligase [Desulfobacteraceae bacterium]